MLSQIAAAAREAGSMIRAYHSSPAHQKEGHFNYVTEADVQVQQYLKSALLSLLPGAQFFAEEQDNAPLTDAPTFVVDPIDGTLNFMRHRGCSAVSIALLEKKSPVMGVVYNPYADEMFTAWQGEGARLNGESIRVSACPLDKAMVAFGTSPYDAELCHRSLQAAEGFLRRAGDLRRTGSAAVDLCDVACGRADVFFELRLRPWDVAAGTLLVKEAGGRFYSLGHETPYFDGPCGILASNAVCAEGALAILREAEA